MRICLVSSEHGWWGGIGHETRRLATMLGRTHHEVTLIQAGDDPNNTPRLPPSAGVREVFAQPSPELARIEFASDLHRSSAAVMEAIEGAYEGGPGPDYLEVVDYHANGLVPLQARLTGHPLLRDTLIGVRAAATVELLSVHDGTLYQPGIELVAALEREQFRLADRFVWRGGDTLNVYSRFYGDGLLPEAVFIPPPFERPTSPPTPESHDTDRPLEILFVGRLQRFKGTLDLVEACLGLDDDNWRLTMIGADTETAPAGQSVRMTIEAMCGDDPRVSFLEPLPNDELQRCWAQHDLLVIPSTLEVWGNVGVEAMRAGLPVLASPVGGPAGYVEHGVSGWHIDGLGPVPIQRALSHLLANRGELERVRTSGAVYEGFLRATDPELSLRGYEELLNTAAPSPRRAARTDQPLVTGVVPYYRSSDYIEEAVDSLLGQSHRNLEVLIVNDGSFEPEDEVLDRLAAEPRVEVVTQLNGGESSARNLGASLARGEYLAMLDADNVLEEDFVARALETLRSDPSLSYVTCWLRYVRPDGSALEEAAGYAPLGNRVVSADSNQSHDSNNWDGDAIALLPRRLFSELGYRYERLAGMQSDWELYRQLREDGRFGAVIPELLARYRVHPDSLSRAYEPALHQRTWGEARTRRRTRSIRWTAEAPGG